MNRNLSTVDPVIEIDPDPLYALALGVSAVPVILKRIILSDSLVVLDSAAPPVVNREPEPAKLPVNLETDSPDS